MNAGAPLQSHTGEPGDSPLLPTPREMVAAMDRTVVGQVHAKRGLATAVYEHYVRDGMRAGGTSLPARTDVLCLHGPSGCGKSELLKTLAGLLGVPTVFYDATRLSEVGYVGENVDSVLQALATAANWDSESASRGILLLDEIDKIRREPTGGVRDVSGEGVQRALLALLSGAPVTVRARDAAQELTIDTSRLLVVLAGAFAGLEDVVAHRLGISAHSPLGFGTPDPVVAHPSAAALRQMAVPEDFQSYGFIPEFVGRVASFVAIDGLGRDELLQVLTRSELSALTAQQRVFAAHGIELAFTRPALSSVVDAALRRGTGARGLKGAILEAIAPVRFELPDLGARGVQRIVVTRATVLHGKGPRIERRGPSQPTRIADLRALSHPSAPAAERSPTGTISDTRRWTKQAVLARLNSIKDTLDWSGTTGSARKWWVAFEEENHHRPHLVLRLAEELAARKATITEFFLAYVYSNTDNIQANLYYLDYTRLKRQEEQRKKNGAKHPKKAPQEPGDPDGEADA